MADRRWRSVPGVEVVTPARSFNEFTVKRAQATRPKIVETHVAAKGVIAGVPVSRLLTA